MHMDITKTEFVYMANSFIYENEKFYTGKK